ncbi:MFS transporter [Streptomyces sp. NPDC001435]|uniref:MFS transporter n=1 Tax=Streptomyces sp. NPDC001435 TaxID=3364576 RepID=UPI0036968784
MTNSATSVHHSHERADSRSRARVLLRSLLPPTPQTRPLALSTALHTLGTGLVVTLTPIYFTRIVGLSVSQIGAGLAIAALIGLGAGIPLGRLSDRLGSRGLLVALVSCQAAAVLLYTQAESYAAFVVAASLLAFAVQGDSTVRMTLIANMIPAGERIVNRAYLRAVTNLGFAVGTALASIALASDHQGTYQTLFAAGSGCFLCGAGAIMRVPPVPPIADAAKVSRWAALADHSYVTVALINSVLQLHYAVLEVGIPLWVSEYTDAPRGLIAGLFLLNTMVILVLQVPIGRRYGPLRHAGRCVALAGALLAAACLLLGLSGAVTGWLAISVLVVAGSAHALGEILHATGSWAASFELAPQDAQGQYQGLFTTGIGASQVLGPFLVTALILPHGMVGWSFAAGFLGCAGFLMAVSIRRAAAGNRRA